MDPQESNTPSGFEYQSKYNLPSKFPNPAIHPNPLLKSAYNFDSINGMYPSHVDLQYGSNMTIASLLNTPMVGNPGVVNQNGVNKAVNNNLVPIQMMANSQMMTNSQVYGNISPITIQNKKASKVSKNRAKEPQNSIGKKDWTVEEEVALTNAWLNISMDPMWVRIHQVWKDNMGPGCKNLRSSNSLHCHWSVIHSAVGNFIGHHSKIVKHPQSGTNSEDLIRKAMRMYEDIEGSIFKWVHCWEIMIKNPKWYSKNEKASASAMQTDSDNKSPTTEESNGDTITIEGTNDNGLIRPPGRKISKERKRKLQDEKGVMDAINKLQCTLEKQININEKTFEMRKYNEEQNIELKKQAINKEIEMKAKEQKRRRQERILNQDLSKLAPAVKVAYEAMQSNILKEWEEDGLFF